MRIGNAVSQRASSSNMRRSATWLDRFPSSPRRSQAIPHFKEPPSRRPLYVGCFLNCIAIALLCTVWLSGCVSILAGRKDTVSPEKKVAEEKGLIKPRMADSLDPMAAKPTEGRDKNKSDGSQAPSDHFQNDEKPAEIAKAVAAVNGRNVDESPPAGKKTASSAKSLRELSDEALPAKRESAQSLVTPKSAESKKATASSDNETKDGDGIGFKKHDHSKYVSAIRGKAINQVNKERDVVLAMICRNTTTEEWSLTLYRKRQRTYSFVSYVWDEIDEKFEQAFVSDQRPISGWKQHLEFSSSDKECAVLKGSQP